MEVSTGRDRQFSVAHYLNGATMKMVQGMRLQLSSELRVSLLDFPTQTKDFEGVTILMATALTSSHHKRDSCKVPEVSLLSSEAGVHVHLFHVPFLSPSEIKARILRSHQSCAEFAAMMQSLGFIRSIEDSSRNATQNALVRAVLGAAFYPQFGQLLIPPKGQKGIKLLTASQEKVCR